MLLKLDYLNPGFPKKRSRRPAVVELTSGNMGTGVAIVCAVTEYPFVAVMSPGYSVERARMMQAVGAEVILVDQAHGRPAGQIKA